MQDVFKQIDAFEKKLDKDIPEILTTYVARSIKRVMREKIWSNVYNKYNPSLYARRYYDEGLLDDANITVELSNNGKTLTVTNVTMANGYAPNAYGGDVVEAVESGTGYTWTRSMIYQLMPYPRPFHQPTEDAYVVEGGDRSRAMMDMLFWLEYRGYKIHHESLKLNV